MLGGDDGAVAFAEVAVGARDLDVLECVVSAFGKRDHVVEVDFAAGADFAAHVAGFAVAFDDLFAAEPAELSLLESTSCVSGVGAGCSTSGSTFEARVDVEFVADFHEDAVLFVFEACATDAFCDVGAGPIWDGVRRGDDSQ